MFAGGIGWVVVVSCTTAQIKKRIRTEKIRARRQKPDKNPKHPNASLSSEIHHPRPLFLISTNVEVHVNDHRTQMQTTGYLRNLHDK